MGEFCSLFTLFACAAASISIQYPDFENNLSKDLIDGSNLGCSGRRVGGPEASNGSVSKKEGPMM